MLKNVNNFFSSIKTNRNDVRKNRGKENELVTTAAAAATTTPQPPPTAATSTTKPASSNILPTFILPNESEKIFKTNVVREESLSRSQSGTSVYEENTNLRQICLTFEHFRSENYHNFMRHKKQFHNSKNTGNGTAIVGLTNADLKALSAQIIIESSVAGATKVASLSNITDAVHYLKTSGVVSGCQNIFSLSLSLTLSPH